MGGEVGAQPRVARDVGKDAQLLLAVVGRQEQLSGWCDEGTTDPAAQRSPDGDVLQVRIGARETPGGGDRLLIRRMQPALGVHERGQRVDVG